MRTFINKYINIILSACALVAGAILPLAFSPFDITFIAFISPAILLAIWHRSTAKQSFFYGLLFGLGFFGTGVSWVYISIHTYGHASAMVSVILTGLFILYLSLFPAINGYVLTKLFPHNAISKHWLAFPALWVLFEIARGWFFTGFPWLVLGYTQTHQSLGSIATISSVYGVSFIIAFISASIVLIFQHRRMLGKIITAFLVLFLWLSADSLEEKSWHQTDDKPLQVSLVQGNIEQARKWQISEFKDILATHENLSKQHWNSQLIVWPEAAITQLTNRIPQITAKLNKLAVSNGTHIISGAPTQQGNDYYNAVVSFGKDKNVYYKRHLVPFGEYTPLSWLFDPIISALNIPMSDFTAGNSTQPAFIINENIIAPFICYEIAFPTLVRDQLPKAKLLLTVTDDSWFGDSIAADQHLQMAAMRSLESGRYQLFASNTGITAIIDPHGNIQASLAKDTRSVLTGKVQWLDGVTPWVYWGSKPFFLLLGIFLLFAIYRQTCVDQDY